MRNTFVLAIGCLLILSGVATAERQRLPIMAFHTMYGVDGPFVGATNAVRGVPGDDLPWEVTRVSGTLTTKGHLTIQVHGLVFKSEDPVPPEKQGINDEPDFRAVVSCLTEATDSTPNLNVSTEGFPASQSGDATIDAIVALPNPCVAPVVFVTGDDPTKWFAVSGFEAEEEGE